jgi:uncharacterized OB-fold protein
LKGRDECPVCLSPDARAESASGGGRVVSWVVYHRAYGPSFADRVPYNVTLVELDEGPRLLTTVVEPTAALAVGARVQVSSGDGPVRFALE